MKKYFFASATLVIAAFGFSGISAYAADVTPPDDKLSPYTVTLGGGDPILTGDWSTYNGNLIVGTGAGDKGKLNASVALGESASVSVSQDATFWVNNNLSFGSAITLAGGTTKESYGQLRVDGGANITGTVTLLGNSSIGGAGVSTGTVSGTITGSYDLALTVGNNAGTILVLSGNNTYTGKTTISGSGYVNIASGNALGTGQDLVISGGLFTDKTEGVQIQKNNITINSGARFGNTAGTGKLTFTGTTTISGTSIRTLMSNLPVS